MFAYVIFLLATTSLGVCSSIRTLVAWQHLVSNRLSLSKVEVGFFHRCQCKISSSEHWFHQPFRIWAQTSKFRKIGECLRTRWLMCWVQGYALATECFLNPSVSIESDLLLNYLFHLFSLLGMPIQPKPMISSAMHNCMIVLQVC